MREEPPIHGGEVYPLFFNSFFIRLRSAFSASRCKYNSWALALRSAHSSLVGKW